LVNERAVARTNRWEHAGLWIPIAKMQADRRRLKQQLTVRLEYRDASKWMTRQVLGLRDLRG
jgi:hypothetical protein